MSDPTKKEWIAARREDLERLEGCTIARWWGIEMALIESGPGGHPVFVDPRVPFLQFSVLGATLGDRTPINLLTYQNDADWGLMVRRGAEVVVGDKDPDDATSEGIYRHRLVRELPLGEVSHVVVELSDLGDITAMSLHVGGSPLLLVAGEVHERWDGGLDFVLRDESVLVFTEPTALDSVRWVSPPGWRSAAP